ncbi:FtsX-like permease family protein [Hahella sp. KA22]|uniref:ABC transporter permease n=1 Tax=Hahella sp. KA22 TaxID=1628392 RepID=UPI000FDF24D6|nr:ABC transporter permease [Hahella sp. KA22]AZZ94182.1 FtsX-like permease family protein [Hahella sp. KA22]QAY57556.1 FtsX-like permease family protein [Hahella sp. KA22]
MNAPDLLKMVTRTISFGRTRAVLTSLGITIGIAAVALLTSIGEGVRSYVMDEFSQFGARIIAINPGKNVTGGMGGILSTVRPLSLQDAEALRQAPYVEYVVPVVQGAGAIEHKQRTRNVDIFGVSADMPAAWRFAVAQGRFLPRNNDARSSPYAVIGHKVKQELFQGESPLGQLIRIGGMRFRVIGVIEPKGDMLGFDLDDTAYIPADLALDLFNREGLMEIDVIFSPATDSTYMSALIKKMLIQRHGREDFTLITQDQMLTSLNSILSVLTLAVGLLGSISLLVGGVGILTTMTTSVRERTSEIGLLRALGATRAQVLSLFLAEAVTLSTIGGICGLLLMGVVTTLAFLFAPEFPIRPHVPFLLIALLLSSLIGLIAGVVPALQASRLNPIDALRTE